MYLLNVGYMEWIDDEGTNIVGVDAWSSLDKRFVNSAKPDFRPFQDLQNSKRGIYSIIDEGQMGNIEFKHLILRVNAGNSVYYIDYLQDRAYKRKTGCVK
jgi:hypothetical protein